MKEEDKMRKKNKKQTNKQTKPRELNQQQISIFTLARHGPTSYFAN